ncbi:NADH-quinone oxidoreductase subunit L [Halobacteriales archaeon SW_7_71_33]|nr:MAG: NADH-quinone oxidoreductase subunit L [Halobacteriales archaeon SW_7_71_33]
MYEYVPAVPLLPLVAFVLALVAGRYMPKRGALAGVLAAAGSLVLSVAAVVELAGGEAHAETLFTWAGVPGLELTVGYLIDPLSAAMLVVVSLVAVLVHVFSLGYMNDEGETGLPRYYAGLGLFTFSMLSFVLADSLLVAFVFFELVGLCSYLLVGFHFREEAPSSAAKKAFLVTRFGDYFFLVGLVGVVVTFGTSAFVGDGESEAFPVLAEAVLAGELSADAVTTFGFAPETWFAVLGLLVLGGVTGKSAQFPLHTWLPDAMEGPTPVSALIHAATMVAAGVYLVARIYGFYALLPEVLAVIAFVGGFTALFAGTMGLLKDELKQVLAYSTISQYGYMMLALGAGGYVAGFFHLTTHALFKTLLFLGAGSVIVAMHHEEDMWEMGGLRERMPVTYYTFLAGSLALAGVFPFAGFWSKDEVLFEALVHGLGGNPLLLCAYAMGLLAVPVTALYTFRMVLLTFHGEPRSATAEDPEPVRWSVKGPLVVLGALATVAGVVNLVPVHEFVPAVPEVLHDWLFRGPEGLNGEHYGELTRRFAGYSSGTLVAGEAGTVLVSAGVSLALGLAGVVGAYRLYGVARPTEHTDRLGAVKTVLYDGYYQDEYQVWLADRTADLAKAANRFDQGVVDGVVDGVSSVSLLSGRRLRRVQTGVVTSYVLAIAVGLTVVLVVVGLVGGWLP